MLNFHKVSAWDWIRPDVKHSNRLQETERLCFNPIEVVQRPFYIRSIGWNDVSVRSLPFLCLADEKMIAALPLPAAVLMSDHQMYQEIYTWWIMNTAYLKKCAVNQVKETTQIFIPSKCEKQSTLHKNRLSEFVNRHFQHRWRAQMPKHAQQSMNGVSILVVLRMATLVGEQ